jgi:hypothetical protein
MADFLSAIPARRLLMSIPRRGGVAPQRWHEPRMSRGELEPCLGAGSPSPEDAGVNRFARERIRALRR